MASEYMRAPGVAVLSGGDCSIICMADQIPATMKTVKKIRKAQQKPGRRLPSIQGEPRRLKQILEDEARSQGVDAGSLVKDSWLGKCTTCPKFKSGICWANKKQIYNPISPGKPGVCSLRRPDGSFKGFRRSRK